jgi:hypothetical protein
MQCPKCETEFPPHKDWRAVEDSSGSSVLVTDCCACHESFDLSELVLQVKCGFCTLNICDDLDAGFALAYPNLVCPHCQDNAVNKDGHSAVHLSWDDDGDNPVFIDGVKCWRRYKFGGYITMQDVHDFSTLTEFYRYHWGP